MQETIRDSHAKTDILLSPCFNNKLWRKILAQACKAIDHNHINLEVINPFGFEVLENRRFLSSRLKRFYCYLGAPESLGLNPDKIVSQYREALFCALQSVESQMLEDFVIIVENDQLFPLKHDRYLCKPTDKLLDIQFRSLKTDLLTDYANYIVATLGSLNTAEGEFNGFMEDCMRRWHMYQVYIIQENIFGKLIPAMTDEEYQTYKSLYQKISNMIQIFYFPENRYSTPDVLEQKILHKLIHPRLNLIRQAVRTQDNELITVTTSSYHYGKKLDFELDKAVYEKAIDKIKNTFLAYI